MTLRERIDQMGLSLGDLSALTGRTRVTIWRWLSSDRYPAYVTTLLNARAAAGLSLAPAPEQPGPSSGESGL